MLNHLLPPSVIAFVFLSTISVFADDDLELLQRIVKESGANRDRLVTWRGQIEIQRTVEKDGHLLPEETWKGDFAFDRSRQAVRTRLVHRNLIETRMVLGDRLYRVPDYRDGLHRHPQRVLVMIVRGSPWERVRRQMDIAFSPDLYFHAPDREHVSDMFQRLIQAGITPQFSQQGNLVVVNVGANRYVVDPAKASNLVAFASDNPPLNICPSEAQTFHSRSRAFPSNTHMRRKFTIPCCGDARGVRSPRAEDGSPVPTL